MGGTTIDGVPYNVDQWDGYEADRSRVIRHLRDNAVKDTVFLTGDIHSGWACDVPADPASYPATGDSVAVELVCTSVTSDNLDDILNVPPRTAISRRRKRVQGRQPAREIPGLRLARLLRPGRDAAGVRMDWYVLAERTAAGSGSTLSTSFNVQANTGKVTPAQGGLA